MNTDRAIAAILTTSLLVVLALGIWLLWSARQSPAPPPPLAAAAPTSTPTAPTAPGVITPPAEAMRHRLAGTVVGGVSFAIIEDANGANALYRPGQTVPGLGELVEIAEDRVMLVGNEGRFEMRIASAPTVTTTPSRIAVATPEPPTRVRRRSLDPSEYESSP